MGARGVASGLGATLAVCALIVCGGCGAGTSSGRPSGATASPGAPVASPSASSAMPGSASAAAVTSLGPDGVRSWAIAAENAKRGDPSWRLSAHPHSGAIQGFADRTYAAPGEDVVLRVSTTAPSFAVTAYRIGWYGGAGARAVWRSGTLPGSGQSGCTLTGGVNLVSCQRWRPSLTVPVTAAFVPGDYLFKLVGSGGQQSYVPLTVWDPTSTAAYLVKNDVFTWQAWNTYGGYDYYLGRGACPPGIYPLCSRARVVSFDRPYDHHGAGSFLWLEAPLVRYLERRGLDVAYVTDLTLAQHPEVVSRHRALLSLGHDECWSLPERRAAVQAKRHGTNVAFFAASAMLRHVRSEPSALGPDHLLVDYRDSAADPMAREHGNPRQVTGNTWSDPPASWPENHFVGENYNGFLEPGVHADFTVTEPHSWAFAGTHLRRGTRLAGVIASDVDSLEPGQGHPANVQILAHSAIPTAQAQSVSSSGGSFYSDMTYYTDPRSRAGVWDSGTNNWIPALEPGPAEPAAAAAVVQRVTGNVLRLLGQGPAGATLASVPNWRRYSPP